MPGGDNSNAAIVTRALERLGLPGIAFTSWTALFGLFIWKSDRVLFQDYFASFVSVWFVMLGAWMGALYILGEKVTGVRAVVDEERQGLSEELDEAMVTEEIREAAELDVASKR